jgi:RNA polymerase sigma factor (sigma-70 family)
LHLTRSENGSRRRTGGLQGGRPTFLRRGRHRDALDHYLRERLRTARIIARMTASHGSDAAPLAQLCREAAAGESLALERLLWLHHARLSEYAQRKVSGAAPNRLDPDDVLQEAYLDIFRNVATFEYRDEDSFYRWAANIIERRFIDALRRARAGKRTAQREVQRGGRTTSTYQLLLDQCRHDSATPSRFASTQEAVGAVLSGLACLPDDYREVLRRLYIQQDSLDDVAAALGRSPDAVRRLASRAVERLRDHLGRASLFLTQSH